MVVVVAAVGVVVGVVSVFEKVLVDDAGQHGEEGEDEDDDQSDHPRFHWSAEWTNRRSALHGGSHTHTHTRTHLTQTHTQWIESRSRYCSADVDPSIAFRCVAGDPSPGVVT